MDRTDKRTAIERSIIATLTLSPGLWELHKHSITINMFFEMASEMKTLKQCLESDKGHLPDFVSSVMLNHIDPEIIAEASPVALENNIRILGSIYTEEKLRDFSLLTSQKIREGRMSIGAGLTKMEQQVGILRREVSGASGMRKEIDARTFRVNKKPTPSEVVVKRNGEPVFYSRNIGYITGPQKVGKSVITSSLIIGSIPGTPKESMGFEIMKNDRHGAVIHIDSEQDEWDQYKMLTRAIRRTNDVLEIESPGGFQIGEVPEWFKSVSVKDFTPSVRREYLQFMMEEFRKEYGSIHMVLIDGMADLVPTINDEGIARDLLDELSRSSVIHDCPIIGVQHTNNNGSPMGWVGSILAKKTVGGIKLQKEEEIEATAITLRDTRSAGGKGTVYFKWDDSKKYHILVDEKGIEIDEFNDIF